MMSALEIPITPTQRYYLDLEFSNPSALAVFGIFPPPQGTAPDHLPAADAFQQYRIALRKTRMELEQRVIRQLDSSLRLKL